MIEYRVVYSGRKSLAIEVTKDAEVIVRAPYRTPKKLIEKAVAEHVPWIERHVRQKLENPPDPEPSEAEKAALIRTARQILPPLVAQWAERMGVNPTGITVTSARTRFGSCSPKDRLSFSFRLMQYPDAAIEYVVVHELAHIRHKNHGPEFYREIERFLPDRKAREALLRGRPVR